MSERIGLKLSGLSLVVVTLVLLTDGLTMFLGGLMTSATAVSHAANVPATSSNDELGAIIVFFACLAFLALSILLPSLYWGRRTSHFLAFCIAGLALISLGMTSFLVCIGLSNLFGQELTILLFLVSLGLNGYVIQAVLRTYLRPKRLEAGSILNPPL
jgi:hypothetical protein